jgi:hypothetical protein
MNAHVAAYDFHMTVLSPEAEVRFQTSSNESLHFVAHPLLNARLKARKQPNMMLTGRFQHAANP